MLSGFAEGMKCKKCGKTEQELEKLGIVMNIPLETCMKCLKPEIKATREKIEQTKDERIKTLEDAVRWLIKHTTCRTEDVDIVNDIRELVE